ncbi:hypothetical protein [Amycolatopsis sp. PS_44_ISF1]|uniref:hypothetical protein n=1 Tax=Amycolatopsis sp. PS_44_ISF1 TaxID=2974917 RepID=UPI0028DE8863|nr:hypothetical protein [Amycolatopsis sp. PS_44_ISF1]MDT8914894.1 hypothetical protein [Amycolatopsis sp. PS_44_ISF1]
MSPRSELFPRDHPDDGEDDLGARPGRPRLPDPQQLRADVPSMPGTDLTPASTEEIDSPPGTGKPHPA